ncbi:hypothetical protein N0B31_18765 [Salinirubellus salinus]|uniref:Uncharacterized protein n=1 Tax=Salinirubellus salinus TaxID=1364945 RepID=A0A9E7R212_9EURY|nr:hypothetical protein [Salinirubellus salinus]UWM54146.1 hypothetical protein N0B31_18765 [Salinirubellus salinus]
MDRRALLASLAAGTTALAGCASLTGPGPTENVRLARGQSTVRPLADPLIRGAPSTADAPYFFASTYAPGDTLAVTDTERAEGYADSVADLSDRQFAVLTYLRVAGAAPASLFPEPSGPRESEDGRVELSLRRDTVGDPLESDEAIGVSLAVFEYEGGTPESVVVELPGGATFELAGP